MKRKISIMEIIRGILLAKAIALFSFGLLHLFWYQTQVSFILAILFFINAGIFFCLFWLINRKKNWAYYFAVFFLSVNILFIIFDQVGLIDISVLVLDVLLLGLLIINRKIILKK